ncbi:MAG: hypothetical protein RLY93_13180 [Sumerlaeia bacterium]
MKRSLIATTLGWLCLASTLSADVTFTYPGSGTEVAPDKICIAGSFNEWNETAWAMQPDDRGGWSYTADIADGEYEYKFVLYRPGHEVEWTYDPTNNAYTPSGIGGYNSYLKVLNGDVALFGEDEVEVFTWDDKVHAFAELVGDFNDWNVGGLPLRQEPDGAWRIRLNVEPPISYKFYVDQVWEHDPSSPKVSDGYGGFNSLRVPAADGDPGITASSTDDDVIAAAKSGKITQEMLRDHAENISREGHYERSIRILGDGSAQADPANRARACLQAAETHRRFGNLALAGQAWEYALRNGATGGERRHALCELGKYRLYTEKNPRGARNIYLEVLQMAADSRERASAHYDLGRTYALEQNWSGALTEFQRSLDEAPSPQGSDLKWMQFCMDLRMAHGEALYNVGQYGRARKSFQDAIASNPWEDNQYSQAAQDWISRCDTALRQSKGG